MQAIYHMIQHEEKPDFNRAPFQLGAFNEIANYRGGKARRAEFFSLGVSLNRVGFSFRFYNEFAQPGLRDLAFDLADGTSEIMNYADGADYFDPIGDLAGTTIRP